MAKKVLAAVGLGTILFAFGTLAVSAQVVGNPQQQITLTNPLTGCNDLNCPVTKVIDFLKVVAVPICIIMVLVGAFQMMTAAGDPEKFSKGRKTILYAAVGFMVVILAGSAVFIIQSIFQ